MRKASDYRVRNWSEYNEALRQRGNLTVWFSQEAIEKWYYDGPPQQGAQFEYSDVAIETALTFRSLFRLPFRQTEGFVRSLIELMGLALQTPDYSILCRRQGALQVDLAVRHTSEPVHVVVDSTGAKVFGEGEWKVRQHGWSKHRTWRKLHLCVDEATVEILASTLTTNATHDAHQVVPLLEQIDRPVTAFGGDGSYDKWGVYDALVDPPGQDTSIVPVIPPQHNARITQHGNSRKPPLPRDEAIRAIRKIGRKRWKAENGYHRRSLAETAMSRYKMIFGPTLLAHTFERQQVEARTNCAILNRMVHLGMPESYKVGTLV
jgi:hypothetical protein